jgi:hypothetical protein
MDQNADLRNQLNEAKAGGHFIFCPSVPLPKVNGIFVPVLEVVRLNPGDFYSAQGSFGIHHHAAMKLADAAGIQWAADAGRVGRMDNMRNPNYCSFRVVGRSRTAEGLWAEVAGQKHIDLDAKRPAAEEKYRKQYFFKKKDGKKVWPENEAEFVRLYTERDINQIRETMDERCESGAQSRVIRNILHLPVSFKEYPNQKGMHDGISRRFYIVRYTLDPANKDVQRVQLGAFAQAVLGVYGTAQPQMIASTREAAEDEQGPEEPTETPDEEAIDPPATDFENSSPEEQEATIMQMVTEYGYKHFDRDMQGQPPLEQWSQENRSDYFKHLLSRRPK